MLARAPFLEVILFYIFVLLSDFTEMLEFLHLLTANYRDVFSSVNNDGEFIAGLCYWLLIMTGATLPEPSESIDVQKLGEQTRSIAPGIVSYTVYCFVVFCYLRNHHELFHSPSFYFKVSLRRKSTLTICQNYISTGCKST